MLLHLWATTWHCPLAAPPHRLAGVQVDIKDLDEVLVRDVGAKIASSGRWPLLIDTSGQASVFLRYMVRPAPPVCSLNQPIKITLHPLHDAA